MNNVLDDSPLGKSSQYESRYNPKLLFPISRSEKREELGMDPDHLPFFGRDLWYGYELSWLNTSGKPVVRVARFELSCDSDFLIESKSFKLYLNSFNQTQFESDSVVRDVLEKDLGEIAQSQVSVELMSVEQSEVLGFESAPGTNVDELDVTVAAYNYDSSLLRKAEGRVSETINTHLLKSNCPVTGQPDWGTLVVSYSGEAVEHESFLRYICSFRNHQEFHEQCVERVFTDLQSHFELDELTVYAQYLRRGGLDINPWRSTTQIQPQAIRLIRQ